MWRKANHHCMTKTSFIFCLYLRASLWATLIYPNHSYRHLFVSVDSVWGQLDWMSHTDNVNKTASTLKLNKFTLLTANRWTGSLCTQDSLRSLALTWAHYRGLDVSNHTRLRKWRLSLMTQWLIIVGMLLSESNTVKLGSKTTNIQTQKFQDEIELAAHTLHNTCNVWLCGICSSASHP